MLNPEKLKRQNFPRKFTEIKIILKNVITYYQICLGSFKTFKRSAFYNFQKWPNRLITGKQFQIRPNGNYAWWACKK